MEIEVGSEWEEKNEIREVVTITGRYRNLDTGTLTIGYEWFGQVVIQDLEEFKKEFRPIKNQLPDKSKILDEVYTFLRANNINKELVRKFYIQFIAPKE